MHYQRYNILSLNVNGLNNPIKRSKMLAKIKREKIDIIFWQETHLSDGEHDKLRKMGYRNAFFSSYRNGKKRGVVILISNSVRFELVSETKDKEGRYVLVKGKIDQKEITLFNIYAPPGSHTSFFKQVFNLITLETYGTLICGGDFNLLLNPALDTTNKERRRNPVEKYVNKVIKDLGLNDVWRSIHGSDPGYTFYSARYALHSRIDYFLMFARDLHRLKHCKIGSRDLSDHSGVYLNVHLDGRRRNTLWRLNVGLLNDPMFKESMVSDLQAYLQDNDKGDVNPCILWDAAKAVLRGKIIARAAQRKKVKNLNLLALQGKLRELEQQQTVTKGQHIISQIRTVKQEIDKILSEEVEKNIRFMKQRYYEAGPRATKLLAWRLRKQQAENAVHRIKDPTTNKILNNPDDIEKTFEAYYKSLYSQPYETNRHEITEFLNSLDLPTVGKEINDKLILPITQEEIDRAIARLNNNKSPGTDGYPPEWYKATKEHLLPVLESCFNYIMKEGFLPPSWKEAYISVIAKEGKDRLDCTGYRPISVLNADYKIYASILTKRMETVMPFLIDEDQTGFIKDRQAQDNIRRTLHVIEQINKEKISSIVLSLDAEKAFDSVRWDFLYLVMDRFGFSADFIRCIQVLYSSPTARIKINGSLSNTIMLQRGCRQGCPASPSLFNIFIEPLAQAIRQEKSIKGILVGGEEYKISMYADDVLLTIMDPESGLPLLLNMMKTYGMYSGYVLNIHKTQVLTFNFTPPQEFGPNLNFNWHLSHIKYLGVYIPKDLSQLFDLNYNHITKKICNDLNRWDLLPLGFGDRVRTIKMNILPRLLYLFLSLPVEIPLNQFRNWNKYISRFIWGKKRPRVKLSTLHLPRESGGMALPSLRDYYISAQLRPLVCWCNPSYEAKWKTMELSLKDMPIQSLLGLVGREKDLLQTANQWVNLSLKVWREVVKHFQLQKEIKLLRWPAYDTDFMPALLDHRYKQWTGSGITALCKIVKDWELNSFASLCKSHGLSSQDFYRYLQLRNYFHKKIKGPHFSELPIVIQVFINAYNSGNMKSLISKLYNGIIILKKDSTDYVKHRWEKELKIEITEDMWLTAWKVQSTTTCSLDWRDFCWKNLIRFFITPKQKSKQLGTQLQCWRNCGTILADHAHIFWSCPFIQSFWKDVAAIVARILGFGINTTFTCMYLCIFPDGLSNDDMYLLKILLAASKKAVTKCWLKKKAPTVGTFISIVKQMHLLEQMTFSIRLQKELGEKRWGKWRVYLTKLKDSPY
uniref:Reverse transcriptase domain-containing protein n=1 Tax=Astyanax mexicanus TaxID=7994 RepID=A0A3B1K1Q0_ASTMX